MTQPVTPPTLTDAQAIAQASAPPTQTKTVTVQPAPYNTPATWRYTFYMADAHGVTPLQWRCLVTGPGVSQDFAVTDPAVAGTPPDALLARLHLAAVSA